MAYIEKIPGNTCNQCREGKYVKNPKTGKVFCDKKCWLNGSDTQSGTTPSFPAQNTPQVSNFDYGMILKEIENVRAQIGDINLTIQKMRDAFQNHEDRLKKLESENEFTLP